VRVRILRSIGFIPAVEPLTRVMAEQIDLHLLA